MKSAARLHLGCRLRNNLYLVFYGFVYKCRVLDSDIHASQKILSRARICGRALFLLTD